MEWDSTLEFMAVTVQGAQVFSPLRLSDYYVLPLFICASRSYVAFNSSQFQGSLLRAILLILKHLKKFRKPSIDCGAIFFATRINDSGTELVS